MGQEADGAHRQIQLVDVMLGEESDAQLAVALLIARQGLYLAHKQLHQRALARTIRPNDCDAALHCYVERDLLQQHLVWRVAERHSIQLKQRRRELLRLR